MKKLGMSLEKLEELEALAARLEAEHAAKTAQPEPLISMRVSDYRAVRVRAERAETLLRRVVAAEQAGGYEYHRAMREAAEFVASLK